MMREKLGEDMADESDDRVVDLLRGVGRVVAPPDFEFKVRARLAQSRPHRSLSWRPVVATSVSVVAIGLALLFVLRPFGEATDLTARVPVNADVPPAVTAVTDSQSTAPPTLVPETVAPSDSQDGQSDANSDWAPNSERNELASAGNRRTSTSRGDNRRPTMSGNTRQTERDAAVAGSQDFSSTGERAISPVGVGTPQTETREPRTASYPVREALDLSGIAGEFSNGRWRVASVRSGSIAEISGIRANDIVEAIDGLLLDGEFVVTTTFNVRKMKIRRNGQVIEISLRNTTPK